eukprot:58537-Amphidinium_carterae.1
MRFPVQACCATPHRGGERGAAKGKLSLKEAYPTFSTETCSDHKTDNRRHREPQSLWPKQALSSKRGDAKCQTQCGEHGGAPSSKKYWAEPRTQCDLSQVA